jgi:hypothetical protein
METSDREDVKETMGEKGCHEKKGLRNMTYSCGFYDTGSLVILEDFTHPHFFQTHPLTPLSHFMRKRGARMEV